MKTIVNLETGKVIYGTFLEVNLAENEIIIEQLPTGEFYNFETNEFYDK
jgi:hypothetical protein